MEMKDFVKITPAMIKTVKKIIKNKGICSELDCKKRCPFSFQNSTIPETCDVRYAFIRDDRNCESKTLLSSCKEFLSMIKAIGIKSFAINSNPYINDWQVELLKALTSKTNRFYTVLKISNKSSIKEIARILNNFNKIRLD